MEMLFIYSVLGWSVYTILGSLLNPFKKKCNFCDGIKRLRLRS